MATTHLGWENRIALAYEYPLGTVDSTAFLWLSTEADTMSLGANATRRTVFGNRYLLNQHLQVLSSDPMGDIGPTPMWFDSAGTQTNLNRILNSHFQNIYEVCPIGEHCYVAHFPVSDQPGTVAGFTIARDIGLGFGSSYLWSSCVADGLEVAWEVGKAITIKPSFVCLDGQANGSMPSLVATDQAYQYQLYQAPNIAVTWNGTSLSTAGFKITSSNGIITKHDPSSITPVGMTFGRFTANMQIKTWVDDDFYSKFVPEYLGTGITPTDTLGTFRAVITGNDDGAGENYTSTIYFYGKIVDIPNCPPTEDGIQTINIEMTSPESGSTYEDAGYYIRIRGVSLPWQTIS